MLNLTANANILFLSRDLSLVTATGNVVQVWKRSPPPLYTVEAPETVTALAFLPEKGVLFAALTNQTLMKRSLVDNHCSWQELPGVPHKLSASSDGEYVAVAISENVYYSTCPEGAWKKIVGASRVVDIEWYKNERLLILNESCVCAVNQEGSCLWLKDLYQTPRCLAVHQRRDLFAVAFRDSLWFYSLGKLRHICFVEKAVIDMVFPHETSELVLISEDGDISTISSFHQHALSYRPPSLCETRGEKDCNFASQVAKSKEQKE